MVVHDLDAVDCFFHPAAVEHVAEHDLDSRGPLGDIEQIEHPHLFPAGGKRPHELTANEAGAAGDEMRCHRSGWSQRARPESRHQRIERLMPSSSETLGS